MNMTDIDEAQDDLTDTVLPVSEQNAVDARMDAEETRVAGWFGPSKPSWSDDVASALAAYDEKMLNGEVSSSSSSKASEVPAEGPAAVEEELSVPSVSGRSNPLGKGSTHGEGGAESEPGFLGDMEDDEGNSVITFTAPSPPPTVVAKPIQIVSSGTSLASSSSGVGSPAAGSGVGRLRNLSRNGHLTLDLQPQNLTTTSTPSTTTTTSSTASSPSLGRFVVTTCPPSGSPEKTPPKISDKVVSSPTQEESPPPAAPAPKDERFLSPYERLQLYIDHPEQACRNGVAVQYVNFIKDAEDPDQFISQSAKQFERLVQDNEVSLRLAFLEQIPNIVRSYKPAFKKLRLMAFMGECIRDENYNVRRLAQVAIAQLVEFAPELMTRETIQASVVPLLIQIFYADCQPDMIIDALNLFCKLLDKVGPDPVRRLFIPEFNKLCQHDIAQVRQACAQNLAFVVRYFAITQAEEFDPSDEYCRNIQQWIIKLAQDNAWHVRETATNVFPQLIDICQKRWVTFTLTELYPVFVILLSDSAKQVRRCATRGLGRIIATSADPSKTRLEVTPEGTVAFNPPSSVLPYRLSESEDFQQRLSLSESGAAETPRRPNIRGTIMQRTPTASVSSPALSSSHNTSPEVRRNYYNRLGIPVISSLSQALNEAEGGEQKRTDPKFNSFYFWQSPLPKVELTEDKTPVILPETVELSGADGEEHPVEEISEALASDLQLRPSSPPDETELPSITEAAVITSAADVVVEESADMDPPPPEQSPERPPSAELEESLPLQSESGNEKDPLKDLAESSPVTSSSGIFSSGSTIPPMSAPVTPSVPFGRHSDYDVEAYTIDKHRKRDLGVMRQLRESGEIVTRIEDILPNRQCLEEFLLQARDEDKDSVVQTAVDFPAVALTVGREFWPKLQECHRTLATGSVQTARELMAASLPRIAEIIGYYYTLVDLVPLLNEFLKDTDSVRLAMIENYSSFIKALPPEVRPMHLLRLCEFFSPDEERNWRYRHACAGQIANLAMLFQPRLVVRNLMDGAWFFAKDRTAEVRRNSCLALSSIFQRIEQQRDAESRSFFLQKLNLFLKSDDFRTRQVFAQMCEDLLSRASISFDSFSAYFGARFWPLFDDRVVAVRLAAARCLLHFPLSVRDRQGQFEMAVDKLSRDSSRSVQEVYQQIVSPTVPVTPSSGTLA